MDLLKKLESVVNNPFSTNNQWKEILNNCQQEKAANSVFPYRKEMAVLSGSIGKVAHSDNVVVFSDSSFLW
ncbi:MAG: hypothetical protein K0R12_1349 [Gammaproteobacteria bacterium]|jgi:hypothetical protein|nr:hypothetical protein [Gammaproteobacteria bacterium]